MIQNCKMRHENGNCLPAGGFCTANKNICEALQNAYEMGQQNIIHVFLSTQQWHVIKKRPMTNDERIEWSERIGYDIEYEDAFIYSNLPDDGEEVLVSSQYGNVYVDKFYQDEGCYFEENGDMDGIVAWMPLPKPYKEEEE